MEDSVYFANILRGRECVVCGADRRATTTLAAAVCAVCHGPLNPEIALLAIARGGAKAACSPECLDVLVQEGVATADDCPACGAPWAESRPVARTCRTCAKDLRLEDGYVALWEAGRMHAFCGTACLAMHRDRVNPFCG